MSTPGGHDWRRDDPGNPYRQPLPHETDPSGAGGYGGPTEHQGPSGYQGLGVFSGTEPRQGTTSYAARPPGSAPPGRNRKPVVAALAAVLLLGGGVLTTMLLGPPGGERAGRALAVAPSVQGSPGASSTGAATTSPLPDDVSDIKVEAVTQGWQGVLSPKENVAYDVPPEWEIETPGTVTGLEDDSGEIQTIMHGVSTAKPGTCTEEGAGPYHGQVGFMTVDKMDTAGAARGAAKVWADATAGKETTAPDAEKVSIHDGDSARSATVEVPPESGSGCPAPKIRITTVAFDTGERTILFVAFTPQGVSGAVGQETVDKIIASLRPAGGTG